MVALRKLKKARKLRKLTSLEPIKRNATRWSSTYNMLQRFFKLKPFLDQDDPEIITLIPSGSEVIKLQKLMEDLEALDPVTKKLQDSSCTMLEVRRIFDILLQRYPIMERYLSANAAIIQSPYFESGLVKVQDGEDETLTRDEIAALHGMRNLQSGPNENISVNTNIVELALKKRKLNISSYVDTTFIPPTSNVVERLFSGARLILTDYRKSMTPYTFECVMFLKMNRDLWDISLIAKLKNKAL